jgi:hypothetical protein
MRSTYAAETARAPPFAGAELRLAHGALLDASGQVARSEAFAAAARRDGDMAAAARHDQMAASARANAGLLQQIVDTDTKLMEDRQEWANRTAGPRLLAVQAHALLQVRHPDQHIEPLKSAEPDPAAEELPELTQELVAEHVGRAEARRAEFAARLEERAGLMVPAEDPDYEHEGEAWPKWLPAEREAILQPPRPLMKPAQAVAEHDDAEMQA